MERWVRNRGPIIRSRGDYSSTEDEGGRENKILKRGKILRSVGMPMRKGKESDTRDLGEQISTTGAKQSHWQDIK